MDKTARRKIILKRRLQAVVLLILFSMATLMPLAEQVAYANARASVRLHPNWGTNQPIPNIVRDRGRAIGTIPNPASRGTATTSPRFVDWFTTSATSGGTRIRSHSIVPQTAAWNLHARWTNPNRHINFWTRPANSGTTTINIRNFSGTAPSGWGSPINRAINSWNNSSARVRFATNNTSNNRLTFATRNNRVSSALGSLARTSGSGTNLATFNISLYRGGINDYVARHRNATLAATIESVMAHELGHAIGLRDNPTNAPNSVNGSIMNHGRQRWVRLGPTATDTANANMIY